MRSWSPQYPRSGVSHEFPDHAEVDYADPPSPEWCPISAAQRGDEIVRHFNLCKRAQRPTFLYDITMPAQARSPTGTDLSLQSLISTHSVAAQIMGLQSGHGFDDGPFLLCQLMAKSKLPPGLPFVSLSTSVWKFAL